VEGILMVTRTVKPLLLTIVILIFPVIVHSGQFNCTRVTDGDTITVVTDGQKVTIRLVGIDAPEKSRGKHEPGQPFSQSSTKHLASLVLNKPVDIVSYGTGRYEVFGEKNDMLMVDVRESRISDYMI
jgi:micrococcal nuclease